MEDMREFLYGKKASDAVDKLTEGLQRIESEHLELFQDVPFSQYFWINYPPSANLMFTEESKNLPPIIIEKAKALCSELASEVAQRS
ncbi:hypothetical protein [Flavobacterium nitrogenifigens]|uniref:Uncharacterized protein n=1 Tax=Flavobacterium nitrogenifigens TaxID=1617283 RepID=A0A521B2Y6_9FLAO|nr:hypothetical protein [Flavobacterium nitrogenifigens]KAF2334611.1 hypothetical protein DM397_08035 [Flavobacterium nitrogenifigens]SMO41409.1 hypothetical protein SAMN06265220_101631 [Flavobacterium nitrogenifigens]